MPTDEVKVLDLTLPTPGENLACDEVLLDWCNEQGGQVLRFWEPCCHFVVVGHGNRVALEVNQAACATEGVRTYRRCSGGGAVLQGPGCLNYSLILHLQEAGPLAGVAGTNRFVMEKHRQAVEGLLREAASSRPGLAMGKGQAGSPRYMGPVAVCGHTDLAVGGRKFSGNAQRRKRGALLFHGTFLHQFDLGMVGRFLRLPSKEPPYRQGRSHDDFLMNLPLPPARLKEGLKAAWRADGGLEDWPRTAVSMLAKEKYETEAWNLKF